MNLVSLAFRNLGHRPVRTALCALGIAVAIGTALSLLALARSVQDGAREGLEETGADLIVRPVYASGLFGGFIPETTLDRIAAIPGVTRVSGALVVFARSGTAGSVLTFGWPDGSFLWHKAPLRRGRLPMDGERHVAVIGDTAAAELGKKLNDDIDLFGVSFKIVGISRHASTVNRGAVLVPLADLQEASYRARQVTIAHVGVEDPGDRAGIARIREAIEAPGSNLIATPPGEVLDHDRNFVLLEAVSLASVVIAAFMSALNVVTALAMATQERTREIGILSAIGWSSGRIVQSILIEGVLLWVLGCAIGVALCFAASWLVPLIPVIGRLIAFRPVAFLILPVAAAALVPCVLGALLPAWRAARMLPAEALRR